MAWLRLDTGFFSHPKVVGLSDRDVIRHLRAMAWCAEHHTDGIIDAAAMYLVTQLQCSRDRRAYALRMQSAGLWERSGDAWRIHDWKEYNLDPETVKAKRKAGAEATRKWREKKRQRDASRDDVVMHPPSAGSSSRPVPPLKGGGDVAGAPTRVREPQPPPAFEGPTAGAPRNGAMTATAESKVLRDILEAKKQKERHDADDV